MCCRFLPVLLALIAACGSTGPPRSEVRLPDEPPRPRVIAEWEPALGTLVAWPLWLPEDLVRDLAAAGTLFVLVREEHAADAERALIALGLTPSALRVIPSDVGSPWTRDWGPHQVFTAAGEWAVVDPVFDGYPWMPREAGGARGFHFRTPRNEDGANADFAAALRTTRIEFPHFLTGGNLLVDGLGRAFCTEAMLRENAEAIAEPAFRAILREVAGIDDLQVLANAEEVGIQHIDCWLKPLDEETLLIKRAPVSHPEHAWLEENVARLAELQTPYGRPYRILRIDCPRVPGRKSGLSSDPLAAYTNSLILGDRVFVPLYGIPGDAQALATFEAALPGHDVRGYEYDRDQRGWQGFDALHCRTRAVFDRHMLHLRHPVLRGPLPAGERHRVSVRIDDRSEAGLIREELRLRWRLAGEATWRDVPLEPDGRPDVYAAVLPGQAAGAVVEYHLSAADRSGRRATLPPSAPRGFFRVGVEPPRLRIGFCQSRVAGESAGSCIDPLEPAARGPAPASPRPSSNAAGGPSKSIGRPYPASWSRVTARPALEVCSTGGSWLSHVIRRSPAPLGEDPLTSRVLR